MAAALNIQKHFSGLRVGVDRRRGRDPFATGFEDDSDDKGRTSRAKAKAPPVKPRVPAAAPPKPDPSSAIAALDSLRDSDDDFLDVPQTKKNKSNRRPSPAPPHLASQRVTDAAGRRGSLPGLLPPTKRAAELAVGQLAYLDESSDDDDDDGRRSTNRSGRRHSPAPKSSDSVDPWDRIDRLPAKEAPVVAPTLPAHTVASPFAGTKYLQDSDSDSDEEAVSSRKGSTESTTTVSTTPPDPSTSHLKKKTHEVQRVDKSKLHNPGVSWRAFSAGRAEQRHAEIEALAASLQQRGRSISFCPTVATDDGRQVPLSPSVALLAKGRPNTRGKSPPRRAEDTTPAEDADDSSRVAFKGNPFAGESRLRESSAREHEATAATASTAASSVADSIPAASLTSASTMSPISDPSLDTPVSSLGTNRLTDSIESVVQKLDLSPQTIPETSTIDHSISQLSPVEDATRDTLSRVSSSKSIRVPRSSRIQTAVSRRSSRRSNSGFSSASPAQAFLSNWARADAEDPAPEPKPDDEGQSIGLQNEFVIGPTINRGAFGVVKEVHSLDDHGNRTVHAVKIVLKNPPETSDAESEKAALQMEHEVSVWRYLSHPHILKLLSVYDTDYAFFSVMELNVGGTLHDLVRASRQSASSNNGRRGLPPHLAKRYAYQLACALRYLHQDIRVCHRDVKLENCLVDLSSPDAEEQGGILRLCDFGLADFIHNGQSLEDMSSDRRYQRLSMSEDHPIITTSSLIGTLEYASPKGLSVNRKLFETAGDVWAFGVVVYALCTGDLPFRHAMPSKTAELILRADWNENALRDVAAGGFDVIDLVKGCLERSVEDRFTIGDALRSPWFEGCREESEEASSLGGWD